MDAFANALPFIVILLAFYLLVIRPARTRQRDALRLQESLAPGQEVMTTSGLIATISAVTDDEVLLEAAPGVVLRWAKPAVGRVLPSGESIESENTESEESGDAKAADAPSVRAE